MGLRIATNVQSLSAQRFLNQNDRAQKHELEKLASGTRITSAADDAAGLAISDQLRSDIRSMKQAIRNAEDGLSLVQVTEGGMNEVSNILVRLKELSIQGASDTISDKERGFIDKEVQQLKNEVNRIANITEFNGIKLLNGQGEKLEIQVGIHNSPPNDRFIFEVKDRSVTTEALGIGNVQITSKQTAQNNLNTLDDALSKLNEQRSYVGALQNRLSSTINNLNIYKENLSTANSRIRDTDIAETSSELVKRNILSQAAVSVLAQANATPQLALKLLG